MVKLIYIFADDWCGIYVNNDIVINNHSMDFDYGVRAISNYIIENNIECNQFTYEKYAIDPVWLEDNGELPEKLDKIPVDVLIKIN